MKIIVDYLTKLDKGRNEFRDGLTRHLSKIENVDVITADLKNFPKRFKWKKNNRKLEKLKPDVVILFAQAGKELLRDFHCYLYLEAILDHDQIVHPSRSTKKLLENLDLYKGILVRTEYLRLYLQNHFDIEKEKVIVTGQGFSLRFLRDNITKETKMMRQVLSIYRVAKPYLFLFGSLQENSYLDKALEAFSQIHQRFPDLKLILVSSDFKIGWDNKPQPLNKKAADLLVLCENLKIVRKVIFTGLIERQHLPVMLSNALVSIYLIDNKLFPLSLVEAMAAGSAMVVSDNPVSKEIAGNSSVSVTPKIADSIAEVLHILITDEKERKRFKEKSVMRAQYYKWDRISSRIVERFSFDIAHKEKQNICLLRGALADEDRVESLKGLFGQFYNVHALKDVQKEQAKEEGYIPEQKNPLLQVFQIIRLAKQNHLMYVAGPGNLFDAVKLLLAKFFARNTYFIGEIPESFFKAQNNKTIPAKFRTKISNYIIGTYLNLIFNRFVIDNILLKHNLKRSFGIVKKIDLIPLVFDSRFSEIDASKLRDEHKLKNYVCILVQLSNMEDVNKIFKITELLYNKTKSFKFIIINKEQQFESALSPKEMKKILTLPNNRFNEALLNSRIYLDMREEIKQEEVLSAMKAKNLCILRKTLTTRYLIKQGINGYLYSSLETDKIAKQIEVLLENRVHLEDIRKINKTYALGFNSKSSKHRFKNIIKKW